MAVGLALIAATAYGVSNYVGPRLSRNAPVLVVIAAGQFIALLVASSVLVVGGLPELTPELVRAGLLAGVGNGLGVVLFYKAAKTGPLSIVVPVGALGALIPVAVGIAGGEPATVLKIGGAGLALGGIVMATSRTRGGEEDGDIRAAALWAGASAFAFGLFLTEIAGAAEGGIFYAVASSRVSLLLIVVATAIVMGRTLRAPLPDLPQLAIPGVLLFSGTLAYSAATQLGELSIVSVVGSLFPVVTVGLAYFLDKERLAPLQWLGVVLALVGVVLLSVH
jgi:drug/metabolite transporter (DMT)-like permease